jgi:hypothetical protein
MHDNNTLHVLAHAALDDHPHPTTFGNKEPSINSCATATYLLSS